jgi:hypothetical protein
MCPPSGACHRIIRCARFALSWTTRCATYRVSSTDQEIARSFFRRVVERAREPMSDEHVPVDSTLIEAWANQKSFQRNGSTDGDGRQFGTSRAE